MKFSFLKPFLLALLFTPMGMNAATYDCKVGGIYYTLNKSQKTASVAYKSTEKYSGYVTIPETFVYNNVLYTVTEIGTKAFFLCSDLTSISIPATVTTIGDRAFSGCSNLPEIDIPASVTSIYTNAFNNCLKLKTVTIDSDEIVSKAYTYSNKEGLYYIFGLQVTEYVIGNHVTAIGKNAFAACNITSIVIGNSVSRIDDNAFFNCKLLKKVVVEDIGAWCNIDFNYNNANPLSIAGRLYSDEDTEIKDLVIPDGVTQISSYAFENCTGLTSVTIPNSVTTIGTNTFYGCSGLTSVTFGNHLSTIGYAAFQLCKGLTSISIPNSVTAIGYNAFKWCNNLTSVVLGDHLAEISRSMFYGCSKLTKITIPNSVTSIGQEAFFACTSLTSIAIPNSVTSIYASAFSNCTALSTVKIGDYLTIVASNAFDKNASGRVFYVNNGTKTLLALWQSKFNNIHENGTDASLERPQMEVEATQTTLTAKVDYRNDAYTYTYSHTGEGTGTGTYEYVITNLYPSNSTTITLRISLDDVYYDISNLCYTSSIGPEIRMIRKSPTSFHVQGYYMPGDATVTSERITFNKKTLDGKTLIVNGLDPNRNYTIQYSIDVDNGSGYTRYYYRNYEITTAKLSMSTLSPKVVSEGNVIVSAKMNVDEAEENVGFEWRRTDWTDDFPSNTGSGALYDGTMEGYIRNLNTNYLWKYRPYYLSDSGTYYYGDWMGIDPTNTSYFEPSVHTYSTISVDGNTALVKGYALRGTDNIKVQGFKYWREVAGAKGAHDVKGEAARVPSSATTIEASGQVMTATLNNLSYDTTYRYVAFVTTSEGETFYGEEQSFTTGGDPTGIERIEQDADAGCEVMVVACYSLNGRKLNVPQRGINILRMSDGSTRKLVVK